MTIARIAKPLIPRAPDTKLTLTVEDHRTEAEIALDTEQEARRLTQQLFPAPEETKPSETEQPTSPLLLPPGSQPLLLVAFSVSSTPALYMSDQDYSRLLTSVEDEAQENRYILTLFVRQWCPVKPILFGHTWYDKNDR
jgi:hypothetical protein